MKTLQAEGITHIVSVMTDPVTLAPGLEYIKHMHIPVDDFADEVVQGSIFYFDLIYVIYTGHVVSFCRCKQVHCGSFL